MQERGFVYKLSRDLHEFLVNSREQDEPSFQTGAFIHSISEWEYGVTLDEPVQRIFTEEERFYCRDRIERYAGRFAAKMAVMQALGGDDFNMLEISVASLPSKKPVAVLSGKAEEMAYGRDVVVSISHDANLAVSMAVLIPSDHSGIGVGTDVASVRRIDKARKRFGDHFMKRQFTETEREEIGEDAVSIAQKWAGKEAIFKILGTGFGPEGVSWAGVEILNGENGNCIVNLSRRTQEKADSLGFKKWKLYFVGDRIAQTAFVLAY